MSQKTRRVCFTSFLDVLKIDTSDPRIRYFVYQQERCPTTGKLHWQGYIEFYSDIRWGTIKKILGDKAAHLEVAEGSSLQASSYCKPGYVYPHDVAKKGIKKGDVKDGIIEGSMVEWGKITAPGERIDIYEAIDDIRNGRNSLAHDIYIMRHPAGYRRLEEKYNKPKPRKMEIFYYWGPPGTGKSHTAHELVGDNFYSLEDAKQFWLDGYEGENTILIDEFAGLLPLPLLLKLTDKYPLRLQYKGGFKVIKAERIVFTSNFDYVHHYRDHDQYAAWIDRFRRYAQNNVHYMGTVYKLD